MACGEDGSPRRGDTLCVFNSPRLPNDSTDFQSKKLDKGEEPNQTVCGDLRDFDQKLADSESISRDCEELVFGNIHSKNVPLQDCVKDTNKDYTDNDFRYGDGLSAARSLSLVSASNILITDVIHQELIMGNQAACGSGKTTKDGTDTEPECEPHLLNPKVQEEKALSLERDAKPQKCSKKDKKKKDSSLLKSPKSSKKKKNASVPAESPPVPGHKSVDTSIDSETVKQTKPKTPVLGKNSSAHTSATRTEVVQKEERSPRKDDHLALNQSQEKRLSPSRAERCVPTTTAGRRDRDDAELSGSSREQTLRASFERFLREDSESQFCTETKPDDDVSSTSTGYVTADDGVSSPISESHTISDRVKRVGQSIEQNVLARLSDVSNANLMYEEGALLECAGGATIHVGNTSPKECRVTKGNFEKKQDSSGSVAKTTDKTQISQSASPVPVKPKTEPDSCDITEKVQEVLNDICDTVETLKKNGRHRKVDVDRQLTKNSTTDEVPSPAESSQSHDTSTSPNAILTERGSLLQVSDDASVKPIKDDNKEQNKSHSGGRSPADTGEASSEHVPPPTPSAMEALGEEDEEAEENDDIVHDTHNKKIEAFGESVCQRLSWLLESGVDGPFGLSCEESGEKERNQIAPVDEEREPSIDRGESLKEGADVHSDELLRDFVVVNDGQAREHEGGVATALDMMNNNFSTPELSSGSHYDSIEVLGAEGGFDVPHESENVDTDFTVDDITKQTDGLVYEEAVQEPRVRPRRKAEVHSDLLPGQLDYEAGGTELLMPTRRSDGCEDRMSVDLSESQNEYNERLENQAKSQSSVGDGSKASTASCQYANIEDMDISPCVQTSSNSYFADNDSVFDNATLPDYNYPDLVGHNRLQRMSSDSSDLDASEDLYRSANAPDRDRQTRLSTASANSMELPEPTAIDAEMKMLEVDACRVPLSTASITRQQIAQISADCQKLFGSDESDTDSDDEASDTSESPTSSDFFQKEKMMRVLQEQQSEKATPHNYADDSDTEVISVEEDFIQKVSVKKSENACKMQKEMLGQELDFKPSKDIERGSVSPIGGGIYQIPDELDETPEPERDMTSVGPEIVKPKRESEIICDVIGSYTGVDGEEDGGENRLDKLQRVLDEAKQAEELSEKKTQSERDACPRMPATADLSLPVSEEKLASNIAELAQLCRELGEVEDKTPISEELPVFKTSGEPDAQSDTTRQAKRRSLACTESDLDTSEQRDDGSTDSMYADDEDDGNTELLFSQSYTEASGYSGSEVLVSCTVVNSAIMQPDEYDSDDFLSKSSAAEEAYRELATSADVVSSTFINARHQMQDIHYHLQNLRRQMESLHEDVADARLVPPYYLEPKSSLTDSSEKAAILKF